MTEDEGTRLLAAVEAMHQELREMRKEAFDGRVARGELEQRKRSDAERQARVRAKSRDNHATESRDSHGTHEVLKALDLDPVKQKQVLTTSKSRDNHVSHVTKPTREAYSKAYLERHGAVPVWNATTNSQLSRFVKRVGAEEAPMIAEFYLSHRNSFYVQKLHPVGLLLQDAEKLRTEWFTGRTMTATQARQEDRSQANFDSWGKHIVPEVKSAS